MNVNYQKWERFENDTKQMHVDGIHVKFVNPVCNNR